MLSLPLTEDDTLELKRDWSSARKALSALAAFANTRGGQLILGVEDDGVTVRGFDPSDAAERTIISEVVDQLQITPEVRRLPAPGGQVVFTLTVRASATLVAYQGRYLMRVGASNREMTPTDLARRALQNTGQSWDGLPGNQRFALDDNAPALDPAALEEFLRLAQTRPPAPRPAERAAAPDPGEPEPAG